MPEQIRVLRAPGTAGSEGGDSGERLTFDSPSISLNEANLQLTALLRLPRAITVTELPTNGATLQCSISLPDPALDYAFTVWKIKKQSSLLTGLLVDRQTLSNEFEPQEEVEIRTNLTFVRYSQLLRGDTPVMQLRGSGISFITLYGVAHTGSLFV